MTEKTDKTPKPASKKTKDVDALLTEVTGATAVKGTRPEPKAAKAAAPKAEPVKRTITIVQVRSGICAPVDQKEALKGLGLRRIRQEVVRLDTPSIRGQIHKIRHLVAVVGEPASR